jgi:hypothetical protein
MGTKVNSEKSLLLINKSKNKLLLSYQRRGDKMEYELEEVERDYIEFRKEMGEE